MLTEVRREEWKTERGGGGDLTQVLGCHCEDIGSIHTLIVHCLDHGDLSCDGVDREELHPTA